MKGILIYQPTSKSAPLADFIDGLDPRLREKILLRLYFLTQLEKPEMKEPHFKRFSIERYRDLWELRVKSKVLISGCCYLLCESVLSGGYRLCYNSGICWRCDPRGC